MRMPVESLLLVRHEPQRQLVICPLEGAAGAARYAVVLYSVDGQVPDVGDDAEAQCGIDFVSTAALELSEFTKMRQCAIFGSLGVIRIAKADYVCIITAISHVGTMQGRMLFRIDGVELVSISTPSPSNPEYLGAANPPSAYGPEEAGPFLYRNIGTEADRICAELTALLSERTFYFGYDWDSTKCLQRTNLEEDVHPFDWRSCERSFFWNHALLLPVIRYSRASLSTELQSALTTAGIFVACFQGFAQVAEISFASGLAAFAVISRVSCRRAGMRFQSRGIDDDGHVSNFVETETLFAHPEYTFSYIVIRGTVPVFWEQQGFQLGFPRITLTRSPIATQPAFDKHMSSLKETYGLVHVLDLLGQKEGHAEYVLSSAFAYHIRKHPAAGALSRTNFDIYAVCKNSNFERLDTLFHLIGRDLQAFGYFVMDASGTVVREQRGVFRVNCLDCLDRTNMTQSYIVRRTVDLFIRNYLLRAGVTYDAASFQSVLEALWRDNGDQMSRIYTGSNAIKSSYGRLGRFTLSSFVEDIKNNARRFYSNNFTEKARQEAIDVFLGKSSMFVPLSLCSTSSINETASMTGTAATHSSTGRRGSVQSDHVSLTQRMVMAPQSLYIMALTWNTGGVFPDDAEDIGPLVAVPRGAPLPHIFVAAFQEIVELSASQIVNVDPEKRYLWEHAIHQALLERYGRQFEYTVVVSHQLVGTAISVFARSDMLAGIRNVGIASKKTGFGGMTGNKGSVAVRLEFFETSICLIGSHFSAGQDQAGARDRDASFVLEELQFSSGVDVMEHDIIVWAGDMNYRVDLDRDSAYAMIVESNFKNMLDHDQLRRRMHAIGNPLYGFREAPIAFAPTYKYDPGTNIYDTSEKMRVPSWTDRVLYRCSDAIPEAPRPLLYDRAEIDLSDHKPVKCLLEIPLKEADQLAPDAHLDANPA